MLPHSASKFTATFGKTAGVNYEQLFPLRREFGDHRITGIDGPDIALRIDADAVRNLLRQVVSPATQDSSLLVEYDYWIEFQLALNKVDRSLRRSRD